MRAQSSLLRRHLSSCAERIPSYFYQTWKTDSLLPFQESNRARWLFELRQIDPVAYQPGSEASKLWVDADFDSFVSENFAWFLPTWQKLTPFIKKVDTIRYMWLYKTGGIYCDLDLSLEQPRVIREYLTRPFPKCTAIVTSNSSFHRLAHSSPVIMMSHAGHDLWIHMLKYIERHAEEENVLACTGPDALSSCVREYSRDPSRRGNLKFISQSRFGITPKLYCGRMVTNHSNSGLWCT